MLPLSYQRPHNLYMERINRHFTDRKLVLWAENPFPPFCPSGVEVEVNLHMPGVREASAPEMDVQFSSDPESQRDLHQAPRTITNSHFQGILLRSPSLFRKSIAMVPE